MAILKVTFSNPHKIIKWDKKLKFESYFSNPKKKKKISSQKKENIRIGNFKWYFFKSFQKYSQNKGIEGNQGSNILKVRVSNPHTK